MLQTICMKRLLYAILVLPLILLSLNCQKEVSFADGENTGGTTSAPIKATVQGRVLDENGQPAAGVMIRAGNATATTNASGFFRIVKTGLDKNASLVTAEKTGYFKAFRTFQATTGANHVVIKLIRKTLAGTIPSSAGGDAILANGARVSLPANAVVQAAGGAAYNGSIRVYAAYIDPTAGDIGQTVPGSFMADDKDGKRVTLASYGMLAVELESSTGEKLQIASGKTATLTAPIPSALLSAAPAAIPLWYVDEQTGLWKEEGSAVRNGQVYTGEVKHFSFWNYDAGFPAINLSLKLADPHHSPLIHVSVRLTRTGGGWWPTAYGYTDSLGRVSGLVPSGETLLLEVLNDCGSAVYSQNIGPFSQHTDLGTITIPSGTSAMTTVSGVIVNCSGAPVSNGVAILSFDGWPRYATANSNGEFTLTFLQCNTSPAGFDLTAVDPAAMQQATNSYTFTGSNTVLGNIMACGTSAAQFINYTLDGINYSITSAEAPDSIFGYSQQLGSASYSNSLMAFKYSLNRNINISFGSLTQVPGTYPISYIMVQQTGSATMLSPSTVTVTGFPAAAGSFFEGSFAGSFRDSVNLTTVHNVNGTFKVRRY